jgi:hypothetical protein
MKAISGNFVRKKSIPPKLTFYGSKPPHPLPPPSIVYKNSMARNFLPILRSFSNQSIAGSEKDDVDTLILSSNSIACCNFHNLLLVQAVIIFFVSCEL